MQRKWRSFSTFPQYQHFPHLEGRLVTPKTEQYVKSSYRRHPLQLQLNWLQSPPTRSGVLPCKSLTHQNRLGDYFPSFFVSFSTAICIAADLPLLLSSHIHSDRTRTCLSRDIRPESAHIRRWETKTTSCSRRPHHPPRGTRPRVRTNLVQAV